MPREGQKTVGQCCSSPESIGFQNLEVDNREVTVIKRYGSRTFATMLYFCLPWLAGCSVSSSFQTLMEKKQANSTQQLSEAIEKMNQAENALLISKDMYRRQLSISFNQQELQVNTQHRQVIDLFFKSLPESQRLNIIISVAPSSAGEPFKTLNDSWSRLQSLKAILAQYSKEIELIYQPELDLDSATIHAVGGKDVQ